jgi:hypothetical protein
MLDTKKQAARHSYERELEYLHSLCVESGIGLRDILDILIGLKCARQTGFTPADTVLRLLQIFCLTGGSFQETFHRVLYCNRANQIHSLALEDDVVKITASEFTSILHELSDNGYSVLNDRINRSICLGLFKSIKALTLDLRDGPPGSPSTAVPNDRADSEMTSLCTTAHCKEQDLVHLMSYREIIHSRVLRCIASMYLGCNAKLIQAPTWLSYPAFDGLSKNDSAQQFHFDMDEIRWLKVIIYLNDVDEQGGAHQYIPGTHTPRGKKRTLLNRGYSRVSDVEMKTFHPENTWTSLSGGAGTIIFADTRCWHRGLPIQKGCRGAIVMQYAATKFGKILI